MDLELTDEQHQLVEMVVALLGKHSAPQAVRASEPLGFDSDLWAAIEGVGVAEMAAPEPLGGASMVDLALVSEQLGRYLAPVPFVETVVAVRTIARLAPDLVAAAVADGPLAFAVRPTVDGSSRLVPGGAVARSWLGLDGDRFIWSENDAPGEVVPTIGHAPVADRTVATDARVLAEGAAAHTAHADALDEWRVLVASSLVGLAQGALELAVAYAKDRHQFGVPIGSFQALAHRLADAATDVDGALLLARKAAWSIDADPGDASLLARMAFAWSAEVAGRVAAECVHIHGGMGFSVECDAQLFYRRAVGWPNLLHGAREGRLMVADELWPREVR